MWKLGLILSLFILFLAWLYFLTTQASVFIPQLQAESKVELVFPSTLEDIKALNQVVSTIITDDIGFIYILTLFISAYLFKQTFAIPGSVFLNLLAGAIFGLIWGFILTCSLTALGATFCYSLAKFAGKNAAKRYFPEKVETFSKLLESNSSRLPYFLLSLRLFPMSPNWAVNMCCGVLGVPLSTFFFTIFLGLMPYNYICVTTGLLLSKLTSINDIFTWTSIIQLSGIAAMATLPAFFVDKKKTK